MEDRLLELLKKSKKPLSFEKICEKLDASDKEKELLLDSLNELIDNYTLIRTAKDNYVPIEKTSFRKGRFIANRNGSGNVLVKYKFTNNEGENIIKNISYEVLDKDINGAIDGDIVFVNLYSKHKNGVVYADIKNIISRKLDSLVGEVYKAGNNYYVKALDKRKKGVTVKLDDYEVEGIKVLVDLISQNEDGEYLGHVLRRFNHKFDPTEDILLEAFKCGLSDEFSKETLEEVEKIPNTVLDNDKIGRLDLTNEEIFTIDGADTKDIDDAVSCKILDNGNYLVGVHIADVSHYVKSGSAIDNDAYSRGTSAYLANKVIPMLPRELSNGICSLNPNVDRLAVSCVMEFDNKGKQINYEIFPSVIRSRKQMTYNNVNSILEDNVVPDDYKEFENSLRTMQELAKILQDMITRRGYINFEVNEAKIIVDENCVPLEIKVREQRTGEKLIESFMIAANECVATHIYFMNLPFIYRVHETPKEEKIRSFLSFVSSLGYKITGDLTNFKPTTMQRILKQLDDKPEYKILAALLLRSMQKAVYKPENIGHYGLASSCYTHFTSPIRRYPDTTVHRLLHTYLFDGKIDMSTIRKWEEKLVYIAEHSSSRERASVDCEREVEDMKMAQYMENHIGEEFEGMISSVTSFGMFVELDNLIEGLVPIRDMKDFFHFDEEHMTLTGERSNIKYRIGERLIVKVVRASKDDKTIDFEVVRKV